MSSKTIREALAALGVIASLLFVGFEIRQNTMVARAAAYQSIGVATAAAFDSAAHDPQWLASTQKTADVMDETDWTQFRLYMTIFARLGETVLLQVEQGLLPQDAMERLGYGVWTTLFKFPKLACVWPLIRPGVSTSFREYVEGAQDPNTIDCSDFDIPSVTPTQ